MLSFAPLLFLSALASRALAVFSVPVSDVNLTTSQLLSFPVSVVTASCNCTLANSTLNGCNDDTSCLCNTTTIAYLRDCEQCLFTQLVEMNLKADFRVGSQAVLSGYAQACNNTFNASQTALTLPSTWDGPFDAVLPNGVVVLAVGSAVLLGISALYILSNL